MSRRPDQSGRVLGRAGGGLSGDTSWATSDAAAAAGRRGEELVAQTLDPLARDLGVDVLHDLRLPIPRMNLNIDHAVVSGNRVLLVDAKRWRPGFYWTVGTASFCGVDRVPYLDKQTMVIAVRSIGGHLRRQGSVAAIATPVVAVTSSQASGRLALWAARVPGADLVHQRRLGQIVRRFAAGPADSEVTRALSQLLVHAPDRLTDPTPDVPHTREGFTGAPPDAPMASDVRTDELG